MPDDKDFLEPVPLTDELLAKVQQAFKAREERHPGVLGLSPKGHGVHGQSGGPGAGVFGLGKTGPGVSGQAKGENPGVLGRSDRAQGVWGESVAADRCGVAGVGNAGHGVVGETRSPRHAGITARGPEWAGRFEGKVHLLGDVHADRDLAVAGTVRVVGGVHLLGDAHADRDLAVAGTVRVGGDVILEGADLAERFLVRGPMAAPGTVMVLDDDDGDAVRACEEAYDVGVIGVVSGAGTHRPALVMDGSLAGGVALALTGKVWVLASAEGSPIRRGDLLTTSPRPGHAQRAADRSRSHGAVLGKALDDLADGVGLVRALVALH